MAFYKILVAGGFRYGRKNEGEIAAEPVDFALFDFNNRNPLGLGKGAERIQIRERF